MTRDGFVHLTGCLLVSSLVACGGSVGVENGDAAPSGDAATDTTSPDTGTQGCPVSQPSPGQSCAPLGTNCEYGDDPRPRCRSQAQCTASGFQLSASGCEPLAPPGVCPATASAATGTCANDGAICTYDTGILCACGSCVGGLCSTTAHWGCSGPQTDPCPSVLPEAGQPCPSEGAQCNYGLCGTETSAGRTCTNGVWTATGVLCPA